AVIADLEQHQQPTSQATQRYGNGAVCANEAGRLEIAPKLLWRQRFGKATRIVLAVMVVIHLLQLANEPATAGPATPGAEADLEVDQVRTAIPIDDDVFALVQVDTGYIGGVNGI